MAIHPPCLLRCQASAILVASSVLGDKMVTRGWGMARKPETRTRRVSVRVTPSQYTALEHYAEQVESTVSDLVREAVDGLASAAVVAGPAHESLRSGTREQMLAAADELLIQAEQYAAMGTHLAAQHRALKDKIAAMELAS